MRKIKNKRFLVDEGRELYNKISSLPDQEFKEINSENFIKFDGYGGIWAKVYDGEIVDVMITTNFAREFIQVLERMYKRKQYKYKLLSEFSSQKYMIIYSQKSSTISNYWHNNLLRELYYAARFRCRFWNPAKGYQTTAFNKINSEEVKKYREVKNNGNFMERA